MREVLFRGQRVDGGGLVYGGVTSLNHTVDDKVFIVTIESNKKEDRVVLVEVKPETIDQFTGVVDKHGEKIFKGDKVRYYEVYRDVVPDEDRFIHRITNEGVRCVEGTVDFVGGSFVVKSDGCTENLSIFYADDIVFLGLNNLDDIKEYLCDNESQDKNGILLDENILGIEIIS